MVKVIALNDDNHDTYFVTKETVYSNAKSFMESCLLKPHYTDYRVRGVYICDPLGKLIDMEEEDFHNAFNLLSTKPSDLIGSNRVEEFAKRNDYFDLFFENGDLNWF